MAWSAVLTVLIHISVLTSYGAHGLEPEDGAPLQAGALGLPWQDELCCDSPSAHLVVEGDGTHVPEANRSESNLPPYPRCIFRSLTTESHPPQASGSTCLNILCRIDENWENVTCDLQSHGQPSGTLDAGVMAISLQRLLSQEDDSNNTEHIALDNPVVCEAVDSFMCSIALDTTTSFVTVVTASISDDIAPPVLLRIPARPEKPSPPAHLSHIQTIKAELILQWDNPSDLPPDAGPLRYEVRYSSNTTHPVWQISAPEEPRLYLDLKPWLNYTIQVRCSGPYEPPLWSDWSEAHHIFLDTVSLIPTKAVARPGEKVTVYCVFNDRSINSSMAMWELNFNQPLPPSQYHPVNQWVSQITLRPSETRMYHVLQCTDGFPYSQIYVEGASIDIKCVTNGDIDAMECSWKNTQWMKPEFRYRWADLPCDVMEVRERAGEEVGEMGPACPQVGATHTSCTIQPLRMNCYKLWLEMPSQLGRVRSKPTYLSPIDYVKPSTPKNVMAVSQSNGVLMVSWKSPSLPVSGLQCQFRYHSPSTVRAQPAWKVQSPVQVPWAKVAVPNMCGVYVVQARCMNIMGTGYWSDWSDSVYSTPQNSRAPERGPDFWRILQEDPYRNQTNVTLLFKQIPMSGNSYCVDWFTVRHQSSNGAVIMEQIEKVSSYSFEWNRELHTVTVEASNSLGSSTNNINMTLDSQPKRRCVHSFHVLVINSTCVSLSWSLVENSSVPLSMVVQWLPQRQQDSGLYKSQSGESWVRLPYTDHPVYLRGDFSDSEEFGFHLYPVFADGEGEAAYAIATRGDPAAYLMLMIISFLSIVLLVTLVLSQNQMRNIVWKDVPNPNKCSWAKGFDFKKVDSFDPMFRTAESLKAWPLLPQSENISRVVIVKKADLSAQTTALIQTPLLCPSLDPAPSVAMPLTPGFDFKVEQTHFMEADTLPAGAPASALTLDALTRIDEFLPVDHAADQLPVTADSSAQSSVTYATVLSHPKRPQPAPLHDKDGSGSSSSDEGNFSANNSDISGSFPGGLWELDSCRGGEMEDPRRSCSYNSVEELSETSEQQDEGDVKEEKDLYYLDMDYPAADEESEEEEEQREEETETELLKNVALNRGDCSVESHPLLGPEDSSKPTELLSMSARGFSPLYLPQFRTVPCARRQHDGEPQL